MSRSAWTRRLRLLSAALVAAAMGEAGMSLPAAAQAQPGAVNGAAPAGVVASAGPGYALVRWQPLPAASPARPVSYTVTASGAPPVTVPAAADRAQVTGLHAGHSYRFRVRANFAAGPGPTSAAANQGQAVVPAVGGQHLQAQDPRYTAMTEYHMLASSSPLPAAGSGVADAALSVAAAPGTPSGTSALAAAPSAGAQPRPEWMVQLPFEEPSPGAGITGVSGQPWTESTFASLASGGVTGVELNMSWDLVEPSEGQFAFGILGSYLQEAAAAHIKLVPIFWESVWPGNDPAWLNVPAELTSTGATAAEPAFWSATAFDAYRSYIESTIRFASHSPGYGGSYIDYGWLDAVWGPPPAGGGIAGYAAPDVEAFQQWLALKYKTIAALNSALGTGYASFSQVPAFVPGDPHFALYQQFRMDSYPIVMGRLLASIRQVTTQPLYIYFGGDLDDAGVLGNIPDNVFALAQRYHAAVNEDSASQTALAAMFGYLSQAYRVPLLNEWTPSPGSVPQLAQWLSHYTLEGGDRLGEDYFLYEGAGNEPAYFADTFPLYLSLHKSIGQVQGQLPGYRTGIMVGYDQVTEGAQPEGIPGGDAALGDYLDQYHPAAQVFTDLAVLDGKVSLSSFSTVVDWGNDLTSAGVSPGLAQQLQRFQQDGGTILSSPVLGSEAGAGSGTVPSQFTLTPKSANVETWVSQSPGRTWATAANIGSTDYSGQVSASPGTPAAGFSRCLSLAPGGLDELHSPQWLPPAPGMCASPLTLSVPPGQQTSLALTFQLATSAGAGPGSTATWTAAAPAGLTLSPSSGSVTAGRDGTADAAVTVSAASSLPAGYYQVMINGTAQNGAALPPAELLVAVAPAGSAPPVSVILGTQDTDNGLSLVQGVGDGNTTAGTFGGMSGVQTAPGAGDPNARYLYFQVAPYIAQDGTFQATFTVTYYDSAPSTWLVQYDSVSDGAYENASPAITLTGSDTWKTATITVDDAYFNEGENGGADFRLAAIAAGPGQTDNLIVHEVSVVLVPN